MSRVIQQIKFPCGLQIHQEVEGWFVRGELDEEINCPLHGKDCKQEVKKK